MPTSGYGRRVLAVLSLSMVFIAATAEAPDWSAKEMKALLARSQAATRSPSMQAQNQALFSMAAAAYRTKRVTFGADLESSAKRILRKRDPDHPDVKKGQWLSALLRRFYDDASARCGVLGRFARTREDRAYFEHMTLQTRAAADHIAQGLLLQVDGLEGFTPPLPVADGDRPYLYASKVVVGANGAIDIDGVERARFTDHRPPGDAGRTATGAVRNLVSAFQFFSRSAKMLARFDNQWAKKRGHVQAIVPARLPALYLNEIARAAQQAKMRRLHVMVMTKRGELRELRVDLRTLKAKSKGKGRRPQVPVTCADDASMTLCAQRIAHARAKGRPLWTSP